MRKKAPSEDWWSVESVTPMTMMPIVSDPRSRRSLTRPSHSSAAGANSSPSTIRYRKTHQPTSYMTAVVPGVRKNW